MIMEKRTKVRLLVTLLGLLVFVLSYTTAFAAEPEVVKIAFTDAPTLQIGDMTIYHQSYAAMLAFKGAFEKSTSGKYVVELYPSGTLGDAASNLEQLIAGTLQGATPADGAIAPFYKNIQVFSIPYLFTDPLIAYDILDGEFGQKLFDDMAKQSGLRVIASYDNGGYRNFTNNSKEIKSAADMQGLKFRTMDSEVHMQIVKSLGASATPIAFLELYSALQTGVVDGQENSAITTLGASLDEVQKYCTLDGHILGLAFLTVSETWYQSLDAETQQNVLKAGRVAAIAARGTCREAESIAISTLTQNGVQVYAPTADEIQTFKDATQEPIITWLKANIDANLVDELLTVANSGTVGNGKVEFASADTAPATDNTAATVAPTDNSAATTTKEAGSSNSLTIVFAVIAALAVLFAAFVARKNSVKK